MSGTVRIRAGRRFVTAAVMSAVATGLAVLHVARPDLRIDAVTAGLLVVAAVPWLGGLFSAVRTPLFSFEYRQVQRQIEELADETRRVGRIAETTEAVELARRAPDGADLDELATEYERVRGSMRAGDARTTAMTGVVGRMIAAVERGATTDLLAALGSDRQGVRLAAYAHLFTRPDPALVIPLVDSLTDLESTPFGQYWGLRALRRTVEIAGPGTIDRNTVRRLRSLADRLGRGTDRYHELAQILAVVGS